MSKTTKIQWCDSTINPTMGCDRCELWNASRKTCYAGLLHTRYGANNSGFAPTFDDVTLFPGRMAGAFLCRFSNRRLSFATHLGRLNSFAPNNEESHEKRFRNSARNGGERP